MLRELRRLDRVDLAGGVCAVGEQDKDLFAAFGALVVNAFDGQGNCIPDCSLLTCESDKGLE